MSVDYGGVRQFWIEDLSLSPGDDLHCPRCEDIRFTAEAKDYGIELACWACPTYIGIRSRIGKLAKE